MPAIPQRNTPTMTTNLEDLKANHGLHSTNSHQLNEPVCSNSYPVNNNHVYHDYPLHNSRNQASMQSQMNNMQPINGSGLTQDVDHESLDNEVNMSTNTGMDLTGSHSYNTGIYGPPMGNLKNPTYSTIQNKHQNMGKEDIKSLSGGSSINSQFSGANSHNMNHNLPEIPGNIKSLNQNNKDTIITNYYGDDSTLPRPRENLNIGNGGEDPGDGLGPLPPKWETAYTERGELYFIDHNTGTSHWLDPRLSKFQKKSLEDCSEDELPYGWEKIEDSLYGTYFIDHVNRKTQYENPVLEAKRRAAEQKQRINEMQQRSQTPSSQSNKLNLNEGPTSSTASTVDIAQRNNLAGSDQVGPGPPNNRPLLPYKFTRNPSEVHGERIVASLVKSMRGLGITIVGGDGADGAEEFLQIKSIVPNSPAWMNGRLQTGDILIYVNNTCVLGFSHNEMVKIFQSILPGEVVTLQVCRGYPLPFDPNDPNTEVVTTNAVDSLNIDSMKPQSTFLDMNSMGKYNFLNSSVRNNLKDMPILDNSGFILMKKPETYTFSIKKGTMGFGFTITDSAQGQKVKKILDRNCCTELQEGDILLEINEIDVRHKTHSEVVQILKDCSKTEATLMKISRASENDSLNMNSALFGDDSANVSKLRKNYGGNFGIYRSKTPTADLYSTQQKEMLPMRPKTPLVDTRRRVKTPNNELNEDAEVAATISNGNIQDNLSQGDGKLSKVMQDLDIINQDIPFMDPYPKMVSSLSERLAGVSLASNTLNDNSSRLNMGPQDYFQNNKPFNSNFGLAGFNRHANTNIGMANDSQNLLIPTTSASSMYYGHHESCFCFSCQEATNNKYRQNPQRNIYSQQSDLGRGPGNIQYSDGIISLPAEHHQNERMQKRVNELLNVKSRFGGYSSGYESQSSPNMYRGMVAQQQLAPQQLSPALSSVSQQPGPSWNSGLGNDIYATHGVLDVADESQQYELSEVTLERQALGFGFRIVGGTEEGSQVTIGHIVPGGAADNDHRINTGDEILSIDGINVVNASHHKVVQLMGEAASRGQVTMILRRRLLAMIGMPQLSQTYSQNSPIIRYPYEVSVSRTENEGFGFVIISSSNQYYGSTIGKLIPGSPADRCGELKVGDHIIAVNGIEIIGMMHGDVVNLIKESGLQVQLTIGCPMKDLSTGNPILHSPNSAQSSPSGLSQTTSLMTGPLNQQLNQRSHLASPTNQQMQQKL